MRVVLKLILVSTAAVLLHVAIKVGRITYHASALQSGEWKRADAEAIGGVWNVNRSHVDPATQPTNRRMNDEDLKEARP